LASGNYAITLDDGVLSITPRAIVIDISSLDKIYGDADPSFTWAVTSGSLVGDDTLSGVLSRVAGENVGNYAISGVVDGDLANGNYDYTINNGQLTINQRPLVLTADSLMKIYGAEDPALTWRISSGTLVEGDNLLVNISRADGSNVGTYAISLNTGGTATNSSVNNNYALTLVDGQLQITPAPLTVTANDVTSYWDLMPPFTASVDGLVNGDTEANVFGNSIEVLSNLSLPLPGNYRLTPTASQIGQNYQVSYIDGQLNLLSSNPGGNYIEALTSTQLPVREALGRELRANIYEGRPLLDGSEDGIVLQVLDGGVKLDPDTLAAWGIEFPQAVLFPTNSTNVGQHYLAELRKFVAQLKRYPDVQVLVEGHSSSTGSLALNQRLSTARAESVAQALEGMGLEANRIRTESLDYQFPVASNLTEDGRLKNQRAVVVEDSITQ
jgi:outer membrane protein OmpA-like peptidoglycan-associated protein